MNHSDVRERAREGERQNKRAREGERERAREGEREKERLGYGRKRERETWEQGHRRGVGWRWRH